MVEKEGERRAEVKKRRSFLCFIFVSLATLSSPPPLPTSVPSFEPNRSIVGVILKAAL